MIKDFIDDLFEVLEVKKTAKKSSTESFRAKNTNSFEIAGVEVQNKRTLSEEHKNKIGEANRKRTLSEETKRKISLAQKGIKRNLSEEARKRISDATRLRNGPHSEETKRKISEANKGHVVSEETRKKLSEVNKGRVHSDKTKRKISEWNKGKVVSEETRRKIREIHKGKVLSEEHKKKLGEASKRADHNRPVMTPNGRFISKESLKQRLISDGVKAPKSRIKEWFKLYPNDYYYIKRQKPE